ncbi:hypothetical protein KEM54_003960 [Ascosphaera aggregata]|nr:hypothetical protein KEM54_003960 [Ascosphaera aggregata]
MAPKNITGFDMKKFVAAANPNSHYAQKDPWARAETWRYTGPFSRFNRWKKTLPGFGTAVVLFAGYCAYEAVFLKKDDHHGFDEEHH